MAIKLAVLIIWIINIVHDIVRKDLTGIIISIFFTGVIIQLLLEDRKEMNKEIRRK